MAAISNKEEMDGGRGWPVRRKKANTVFQKPRETRLWFLFVHNIYT